MVFGEEGCNVLLCKLCEFVGGIIEIADIIDIGDLRIHFMFPRDCCKIDRVPLGRERFRILAHHRSIASFVAKDTPSVAGECSYLVLPGIKIER